MSFFLDFKKFPRCFTMSATIKGISKSDVQYDGAALRVAIVHARWNKTVIDALVAGAIAKLKESGVKESNIIVQSVPGSFELPLACSRYVRDRASSFTRGTILVLF